MPTVALQTRPAPAALPPATIDIKTLLDEHDRIDALAEVVVALAAAPSPDMPATTTALATLATLVTEHLRAEEIALYPMLVDIVPNPHLRDAARAAANFEGLRADWLDFLGEWTPDCVESDWIGFGEASRTILARLRARVEWETAVIYPYALRLGVIRLRSARGHA